VHSGAGGMPRGHNWRITRRRDRSDYMDSRAALVSKSDRYCLSDQCSDSPAEDVMPTDEYSILEESVATSIPRPPPGGWSSYCKDHLFLFYVSGRWDPQEPLWRDDLIGCRSSGCPGVGGSTNEPRMGTTIGPAGDVLDGFCLMHTTRYSIYGSAARPKSLRGRDQCEHTSPPAAVAAKRQGSAPDLTCHEPEVANGLCLLHVCENSTLSDARRVLATWDDDYEPSTITSATDDTWRVLAEIQAIRHGDPSRPGLPYNFDALEFGLSMFLGGPNPRHLLHWALKYSPYELGTCLDITPELAAAHIGYLKARGYVREETQAALPERFCLVVRQLVVSRDLARHWRWTKHKHRLWSMLNYHPGHMVQQLPDKLPGKGETRFVPVIEGPGLVEPRFQGRCLELTEQGSVGLRQWRHEESERRRRDLAEGGARRLALIGVSVGAMTIVSIVADADQAWANLQAFLHWLNRALR
jgi:hypothetical protein